MKNIERFNDEIKCEVLDGIGDLGCMLYKVRTNSEQCKHKGKCSDCVMESIKWLNEEYVEPIRLTKAEKVILENLDKRFTWIAKPKNAYAKAYQLKPVREENDWNGYSLPMSLIMFPNLFQFIRWEDKPLEIAWLLENCEVEE